MKLLPLNNYMLVKPLERERTSKSGILLPDSQQDSSLTAKVISLSDVRTDKEGTEIPHLVKEGEIVVHRNYGINTIVYENETHYLLNENEILGVIR